jgi:DNA-directed RNA polymerase subunit RPC12/RpoP
MGVVIVCAQCGKQSQVAEGLLGQTVVCPACGQPTIARTEQPALPVAKPLQTAPLSLDDDPPAAPKRKNPLRTALYALISLLVTLTLMAGIYFGFKYGNAEIPDRAWITFQPPGGRCDIRLPGEPVEEKIAPEKRGIADGRRFVVDRWFEGVVVSFGWFDFSAGYATNTRFDDLAADIRKVAMLGLNLPSSLTAQSAASFVARGRKFEVRQYQGDLKPGVVLIRVYFDADPERLRYRLQTEIEMQELDLGIPSGWDLNGPTLTIQVPVEYQRRIVEPGQVIRVYFATASGKKLRPDTAWVSKFFNSFTPE